MHNSLIAHLRGYVEAMFKDIAHLYRQSREMERDKTRLLHELDVHGQRTLTIDLPALCKHLDKCLSKEVYTPSNLKLGHCGRMQVPVFLRSLYLHIFTSEGLLLEDPSEDAVAALRQLLIGCKKILLPTTKKGMANAIEAFCQVETDCRKPSLNWDGDWLFGDGNEGTGKLRFADFGTLEPVISGFSGWNEHGERIPYSVQQPGYLDYLQTIADKISASFGDLSLEEPDELPRHGPGVTSELTKRESKYSFKDWPNKLDLVFPFDLYGTHNLGMSRFNGRELSYRNREVPSRLIAVPYDSTKPRLIAAEPSQHQWIQQLVRNQLEARLERSVLRHCVRFEDQTRNQELARKGSLTGLYATIDLSSASDRLTCAVVERIFRSNTTILERLHAARTRLLSVNIEGFGARTLKLKKFAAMGSAVTFPVQSIAYAIVAIAATMWSARCMKIAVSGKTTWPHDLRKSVDKIVTPNHSNMSEYAKLVSVFGDDIIVPTYACRLVMETLEFLGLQVNQSKTFKEGNFRESCGVEAFRGADVSPAKVKLPDHHATTTSLQSLLRSSNNFWEKGWWHTAKWLEASFSQFTGLIPVVSVDSGLLGVTSFCGGSVDHLRHRWNKDLQRWEVKAMVSHSKVHKLPTEAAFRVFQFFTERPAPDTDWESGTPGRKVSDMRPGWVPVGIILDTSDGEKASR